MFGSAYFAVLGLHCTSVWVATQQTERRQLFCVWEDPLDILDQTKYNKPVRNCHTLVVCCYVFMH